MVRSDKTMDRRNTVMIYVRDKHKPVWKEFNRLIEQDDDIKKLRTSKKVGLVSIALMNLVYQYVVEKNPEFKLQTVVQHEDGSD